MTIHIDRLYHYVESAAENILDDRVIIYRFWPHGSKNIENLLTLQDYGAMIEFSNPQIFCNDQEPLNFDYYEKNSTFPIHNLRCIPINLFDQCVLLHSERNGQNLAKYQQHYNFVTAYYWCHAVLARDWFRYAEHVDFNRAGRRPQKTFLIYNRAWGGTREYRLKLCDLLIDHDLVDDCLVTASFTDPESCVYYQTHDFKNPGFKPKHRLENHFAPNKFTSDYSADFVEQDYFDTDIEVVLETLFNDDRWHLTEKILRPIACAQPFLLCGTPGALQYLRSYGFETFDTVWSESYDQIKDGTARLEQVATVMQTIKEWDPQTRSIKLDQARQIAKRNQQHFFSKMFFNQVIQELKDNLTTACQQVVEHNTAAKIEQRMQHIFSTPEIRHRVIETGPLAEVINEIQELIQQTRNRHKLTGSQ
jgi:hypothetical protein